MSVRPPRRGAVSSAALGHDDARGVGLVAEHRSDHGDGEIPVDVLIVIRGHDAGPVVASRQVGRLGLPQAFAVASDGDPHAAVTLKDIQAVWDGGRLAACGHLDGSVAGERPATSREST